jgi:hypothetical protein
MLSGANAFEISNIQEDETAGPGDQEFACCERATTG